METLIEATDRLRDAGFKYDLAAVPSARLQCGCGEQMDADSAMILQTVRFEGDSNPDDEDILLALITPCGHAGILTSAYGSSADLNTTAVLSRLRQDPRYPRDQHPTMMPTDLELAHTSKEFTDRTVPPGLLRAHQLASDVWGRLCVRSGHVLFSFEASSNDPIVVSEGGHVDIPPDVRHHVEPQADARFVIEFYRAATSVVGKP
jgi:tellurite resistance-related uncharacterized protein